MAGNMAWKVGKGALHKFNGKTSHQDPTIRSVDHSHYQGPKVTREDGQLCLSLKAKDIGEHRKNSLYYEYKGLSKKDAKTLSHVVFWAKFLDNGIPIGFPPLCFRIGVNTLLEIIPEGGIAIGALLSFILVWQPARRLCKREDKDPDALKLRKILKKNFSKMVLIGTIPWIGDAVDSVYKFNVKNADALEAMLLKRVDQGVTMGRIGEEVGKPTGYQHGGTNGYRLAASNGYHNPEPPTHLVQRFVGKNDLRHDPAPATVAQAPMVQTHSKKGVGDFFHRRGGRQAEEATPSPRPRPERSNYQHGGHF